MKKITKYSFGGFAISVGLFAISFFPREIEKSISYASLEPKISKRDSLIREYEKNPSPPLFNELKKADTSLKLFYKYHDSFIPERNEYNKKAEAENNRLEHLRIEGSLFLFCSLPGMYVGLTRKILNIKKEKI